MFVTIINDCNDPNESARQLTRANILFNCPANSLRLGVYSDIQSAGNLIDVLDASEGQKGIVIVNVAPRFGAAKRWSNGAPFGFFKYKETIVVMTINPEIQHLLWKLKITNEIYVTEISEVIDILIEQGLVEMTRRQYLIDTQFRSFEYAPKLAKLVFDEITFPTKTIASEEVKNGDKGKVWFIDSFGNCKTTLLKEDLIIDEGGYVQTNWGKIKYHEKLKDVQNEDLGIYVGSSGIGLNRFVEITIQGGNASAGIGINVGDEILC